MDSLLGELNSISSICAQGFIADFSNREPLAELIAGIKNNYEVDTLVNSAGFGYMSDFYRMPQEIIDSMQEVNMSAVVMLCYAFLPGMIKKSSGGIINVGSVASFFATPGSALYGATKHFIAGFTDALHREMLGYGVHVTGVYPGHTDSYFALRATGGRLKNWDKAMSPVKVSRLALQGLSQNKVRVIPGFDNRLKAFAGSILPPAFISRQIYKKSVRNHLR